MKYLFVLIPFLFSFSSYDGFDFDKCMSNQFVACMEQSGQNAHTCDINARMHCVEYFIENNEQSRARVNEKYFAKNDYQKNLTFFNVGVYRRVK